MTTFRLDPFGDLSTEFNRVSDELNRVFGFRAAVGGPPVTLWTDADNVYVDADLPAIDPAKLDVTVTEGDQLTIQGERPAPEAKDSAWVRQERPYGKFARQITLPVLVDADKVVATYEHGVLKLVLPKSEAAKPRKITIK